MQAKELAREVRTSILWFTALVAGCYSVVWLVLDSWPDEVALLWLVRGIVVATHLLIWRQAVGRLHDVDLTGRLPAWLIATYSIWFGLMLLFQAGCIFCLPILDILHASPIHFH